MDDKPPKLIQSPRRGSTNNDDRSPLSPTSEEVVVEISLVTKDSSYKKSSSSSLLQRFGFLKQVLGPSFLNKGFFNVVVLGFSFFLLFAAFGTTQSFVTTVRKSEGFVSLSILYAVFAFSNFFAPSFCQLLTPKYACIIGALCYCLFVFAAGFESTVLFYSASVVNGFGAAMVWCAQGTMITQSAVIAQNKVKKSQQQNEESGKKSVEVMGLFSGVFFAIFQLNSIFGNSLAGALFGAGMSNFQLFFILSIIAVVGVVLMLAVRPISKSELENTGEESSVSDAPTYGAVGGSFFTKIIHKIKVYFTEELPSQAKQFVSLLKESILVLISPKMLVFSIISFHSGFGSSYFTGSLPPIIGKKMLGWVMIMFGITQVSGALISGKMLDKIGKRVTMIFTMVIYCIAIALSSQMVYWGKELKDNKLDDNFSVPIYLLFFVNMALFGLSDSFLTNTIYGILGSKNYYKKKNTAEAFAAFKMTQSLSSAVGFFCGIYLTVNTIQIIIGCSFVACLIAFFILEKLIAPVDPEKKKKPTTLLV